MKAIFTLLLSLFILNVSAQWSDTNNQFYDSLHTPVCTAVGEQLKSIVVKSYPDSGYFVIWEDHRRGYYEKFQIFAQKYDETGKQLWANDGVAISAGTNSQHFTFSSNNDYRNYSVAATDSAGGFYLGYADDSVSNYVWERLTVQHMRNDGTTVFPGIGSILFTSDQANQNLAPQLIADGNGGFFISYLHAGYGTMDLFVYCYKDVSGTLKPYGGGMVNENGVQIDNIGYCGHYPTVVYPQAYVIDYSIYPDLQNGCNVVMEFSQNGYLPNTNNRIQLAFNWLWRAKKDVKTKFANYSKDDVVLFYKFNAQGGSITCKDLITGTIYIYPTSTLISEGFVSISDWVYGAERTKGRLVQTEGNINVNVIAVNQRDVNGNTVSDWFTRAYYRRQQKFDSIPYEYTVDPFVPNSFNDINIPGQNKLGNSNGKLNDTLLYNAGTTYFYDFSLASGGNKIFATGIMGNGQKNVLLQQLQVQKVTADSFAVQLNTASNKGVFIGKETSTGFSGTDITYNNPQVLVDNNGNGLFYIMEMGRSTRVSPIFNGAQLAWGAMGKPTGSGYLNTHPYLDNTSNSTIAFDPLSGTGVLSWNDLRTPPSTDNNIYMRHLDNLNVVDYFPPISLAKKLVNPYGATTAFPAVLTGSSKKFTTIEAHSVYSGFDVTTPIVQIMDNYNLGSVAVSVYENAGAIRKYNGSAYLDRNYTIKPENNPSGAASINVRLFFTQGEFDALKADDPSVTSPGDLAVIKQPATGSAPASYIFVAGELKVFPQSWAAVPGGYYIEIAINSFSNFFIESSMGALPVTWLGIQAQWSNQNQAKVSWQVADQKNVKNYTVQFGTDGSNFKNGCTLNASSVTSYTCVVPADNNSINYYRIMQQDIDGKIGYSKIVALNNSSEPLIELYPNPAKNKLFLKGVNKFSAGVITDVSGKIISINSINASDQFIDISQLSKGLYFLKLTSPIEIKILKFIKE